MRTLKSYFFLWLALAATLLAAEAPKITAAEAAKRVADGKAVLVDVREAPEWAQTGVAEPAVLLPKSDFDGPQKQWREFLASVGHKEIVLYCRSGRRAGVIGAALAERGLKVSNAGGFKDWTAAGLPIRQVSPAAK